jgi:hypothetical protein
MSLANLTHAETPRNACAEYNAQLPRLQREIKQANKDAKDAKAWAKLATIVNPTGRSTDPRDNCSAEFGTVFESDGKTAGFWGPKEHEFCNPPPSQALQNRARSAHPAFSSSGEVGICLDGEPPPARPRRAGLWRLRDDLRGHHGEPQEDRKGRLQIPRPAKCGCVRITAGVEVRMGDYGASYGGLVRCASVWACPVCAAAIKAERAAEISALVAWHGADRTAMLTLTVRHGVGEDFAKMTRGLSNAYRRMTRGKPWKRFCLQWGISGQVRALETTHGNAHGWHPHLHILLLLGEAGEKGDWKKAHPRAWTWLAKRWRACVIREPDLGADFAPDVFMEDGELVELDYDVESDRAKSHGIDCRELKLVKYLSKLGLEISNPDTKQTRSRDGRTPFQIAQDLTTSGRPARFVERDAALWATYVQGTKGRKMLTWTRGLKARAGIGEKEDRDVIAEEESGGGEPVATIDADDWRTLRRLRGARLALLEKVERHYAPWTAKRLPDWQVRLEPFARPLPPLASDASPAIVRLRAEVLEERARRAARGQEPTLHQAPRCDDMVADYIVGLSAEELWRDDRRLHDAAGRASSVVVP